MSIKLKRPKRIKLKPYRKLRKQAWDVFSKWIRARDGACVTCGSKENLQAGHFIHKDCLDFDPRAVHAQCVRCNHFLSGNLVEYTLFMQDTYGQAVVDELMQLAKKERKYSRQELEEIIRDHTLIKDKE